MTAASIANKQVRFNDAGRGRQVGDERVDAQIEALQFREFADNLPTLCWAAYADGYIFWYNRRWYEYTGSTPDEMEGWGWQIVHEPGRLPEVLERWTGAIASGEPFEMVFPLRAADGSFRPFLTRVLPLRNVDGRIIRWFGVNTDIEPQVAAEAALRRAAEDNALLTQELGHRIKNIFAIVGGLIGLSARSEPSQRAFADHLRERIAALGRAHDFARPHSAASQHHRGQSTFHALLRELFVPYASSKADRIIVSGEDLPIDANAATPIALIFHELATNAVKYGALSVAAGQVDVFTRLTGDRLEISWTEHGGPPVTKPEKTGFGTQLTAISIERQLGGTIERRWTTAGLRVRISVDPARLSNLPNGETRIRQ